MAYLTIDEFKAMPLPVTDKQWDKITDPQIQKTLDAATTAVERWLDRKLELADYVQQIWGSGRTSIVLENYPVTELTSVTSTDMWGTIHGYDTTVFLLNSQAGILTFLKNSLPNPFLQNNAFYRDYLWTISYTAGFSSIPEDVKFATAFQAVDMLDPLFRGGVNMSQLSLVNNVNEKIVDLLDPYKRKRMG